MILRVRVLIERYPRAAAGALLLALLLLPAPALVAPHVAEDPVRWAYRVYHPFMYRYPAILGAHTALDPHTKSGLEQSLAVLRLMVEYW